MWFLNLRRPQSNLLHTISDVYRLKSFDDLTPDELMCIYRLRQQVFMIEQNCLYEDIDGIDPVCDHLMQFNDRELIAYLRIVPAGVHLENPAIGRIIVRASHRGGTIGPKLIREGISICSSKYSGDDVSIEAQFPLLTYYQQFGFESVGEVYIVDDIPHIHMILSNHKLSTDES